MDKVQKLNNCINIPLSQTSKRDGICLHLYCYVYGVRMTKITASSSDDWIY
jgi:hypothetical protein